MSINDNPQLKEILNKVRFSDLYDQMQWIQQFSKGLINNTENIDYIKIITQVDSSLIAIIEELKIAKDKHTSLKNLALQNSLYLFEHDLWNVFIPKEEDYEIIEGDYEIMNKTKTITMKERMGPDYVNTKNIKEDPLYLDMTLFRKKQALRKEDLERQLLGDTNEIKNLNQNKHLYQR